MSRITNPSGEPTVNCGFFDSFGGDRKYYTSDISHLFDGIIRDGIFASIGDDPLGVTANGVDNVVTVGSGKCWFNHTFTENEGALRIACPEANQMGLDRYDAIIVEIDKSELIRDCSIKVISGKEHGTNPERPELTRDDIKQKYQYALCYIKRNSGSTVIRQTDIEDVRGDDETPFVTGILDVLKAEKLFKQWDAELDDFVEKKKDDLDKFMTGQEQRMDSIVTETDEWSKDQKAAFVSWFDTIKGLLSEDAAGKLQVEIDEVQTLVSKSEIERLLTNGLVAGSKTFSEDGSVITSVDDTNGYQLVKTFSSDFSSCTTVLTKDDIELGKLIKTFNSDGSISSEITIN